MKQMKLATIKGFEVHSRAMCKAAGLTRMQMLVPWAASVTSAELTSSVNEYRM